MSKPIPHILLLACLAFLLIACGGTSATPVKKSTPTATPVAPGQLLFQANWSHGLGGWQASVGWKVVDRVPGKDGYQAYVNSLLAPGSYAFSVHPAISVIIEPIDAMDGMQQVRDYEPGFHFHTYRLEVRGASVQFYVDDQRASAAISSESPALSTGPLRLECSGVAIRVSSLRILTA